MILDIQDRIEEGKDGIYKKSRDMGATFNILQVFDHRCQFHQNESYIIVSGKEKMVEFSKDPNTLFWKLDFILEKQPSWLKPRCDRVKLHYSFLNTGCTIAGAATVADVARSGRPTAILFDEFQMVEDGWRMLGASGDATNCRLFLGTAAGPATTFYAIEHTTKIEKVGIWWWTHPEKKKGLYKSVEGKLEILDKEYLFPPDYPFILDGKLRSPAYDKQEARCLSPTIMAQEWDGNDAGAGHQYFDPSMVEAYIEQYCSPPLYVGELKFDAQSTIARFQQNEDGNLRLWCHLEENKPDKRHGYIIGVDIALGTGASNSCISIVDIDIGKKVGEYRSPHISAVDLAGYTVALGRWFGGEDGARMIWEMNGEGRVFGKTVVELEYGNIFFKRDEDSIFKKETKVPGWWTTDKSKSILFSAYAEALKTRTFINPSKEALRECLEYIRSTDGSIIHAKSVGLKNPTGARAAHGDIVIADALANFVLRESEPSVITEKEDDEKEKTPPGFSPESRREEYERKQTEVSWLP